MSTTNPAMGDLAARDVRTLRMLAARMLDSDPIEVADRVEMARDVVELADRLVAVPEAATDATDAPGNDVDGWRLRYSALVGKVDEWVVERFGDAAREDLVADLAADGWFRMGAGWHVLSDTPQQSTATHYAMTRRGELAMLDGSTFRRVVGTDDDGLPILAGGRLLASEVTPLGGTS